ARKFNRIGTNPEWVGRAACAVSIECCKRGRAFLSLQETTVADEPQEKTKGSHAVPTPPHPTQRQRPLPEQQPTRAEVEELPAEVQRIIGSKSYREADQDQHFIQQTQTRGILMRLADLTSEPRIR